MSFSYCTQCLQPNTRPNIVFSDDGVCPACEYYATLKNVDWDERLEEIRAIIKEFRPDSRCQYDCIIGVSGGKDSLRQALFVKNILKANPLLVCLGYPPKQVTQRGVDNLSLLIEKGFDCILIQPAPVTWNKLMRRAFLEYGNWAKSTEYALFASVPRFAVAYQIPLVLWGENPALQLGDNKTLGRSGWDGNSLRNMNTLQGGGADWMLGGGVVWGDILQYHYPSVKDMDRAGIQIVYLGYFWHDWSLLNNAEYSVVQGLAVRRENPDAVGDPFGVAALDEDWVGVNQMIKYLKFGFGRTTDYVNEEIRKGMMTREEGIALVERYDGKCSDRYIESFCEYIEIDTTLFWETVDRYVNKELFKKDSSGRWVRRFTVGESWA